VLISNYQRRLHQLHYVWLTNHYCDETSQPQPLSIVWKDEAAWKGSEC